MSQRYSDTSERRCIGCGVDAPIVDSDYDLIGPKHGWRLTIRRTNEGRFLEWRCPECWAEYRKRSIWD